MSLKIPVARVESIETHPTQPHNSVVKAAGYSIVTMKAADGSFRFSEGELVVIVPENAIVPDDLLQATGFWNEAKNKGGLAGSKGNRVKGRIVDGVPSQALIWRQTDITFEPYVEEEADISAELGITEYVPQ